MRLRGLNNKSILGIGQIIVLASVAFVLTFPVIWMFLTSLKSSSEIFQHPLGLFPEHLNIVENIRLVLQRAPFGRYYLNTIIVVGGLVTIQLLLAIPAAYAFGCMRFKGQNFLFMLVLLRFIVVPVTVFLPNYRMISQLHLVDTLPGVMLPYFASAMAIFLLRQSFRQIPQELIEAAKVDGANSLQVLYHIGIPLIKPAIFAFIIISSVYHWNEFFWPFLVAQTPHARTLSVGLGRFGIQTQSGAEWALSMTAALIVSVPVILAYLIFQRNFVRSFMRSGLK